jgi:hypothetical protein
MMVLKSASQARENFKETWLQLVDQSVQKETLEVSKFVMQKKNVSQRSGDLQENCSVGHEPP